MSSRVLFGASGRLGSAFVRQLGDASLLTPARAQVDVKDATAVTAYLDAHKPTVIINTTAYNKVDLAEGDGRAEAFCLNEEVPATIARWAHQNGAQFIHFSTDYVFDGTAEQGYVETDAPNPLNVYGASKHAGERAVLDACPTACVVRVSRLYGRGSGGTETKKDFIEIVKERASQAAEIDFLDTECSSPTYVDDVAAHVNTHLLNQSLSGIFHIVNSGEATWYGWAQEIVSQLSLPATVTKRPAGAQRAATIPLHTTLHSTRLPAMRAWQEALREYLSSLTSL